MSSKSTRQKPSRKASINRPQKPYPDFPLSPHPSGMWQKKIRGKIHYFGRWGRIRNGKMERIEGNGWQAGLELYKAQADDLHAGRTPRIKPDGTTVANLCNQFLTAKLRLMESGEIAPARSPTIAILPTGSWPSLAKIGSWTIWRRRLRRTANQFCQAMGANPARQRSPAGPSRFQVRL